MEINKLNLFGFYWFMFPDKNDYFEYIYSNDCWYMDCWLLVPIGVFPAGEFIKIICLEKNEVILYSDKIAPGYLSSINYIPVKEEYMFSVLTYFGINSEPIMLILSGLLYFKKAEFQNIDSESFQKFITEHIMYHEKLTEQEMNGSLYNNIEWHDRKIKELQDMRKIIRPDFDFRNYGDYLNQQIQLVINKTGICNFDPDFDYYDIFIRVLGIQVKLD